MCLNHPQTISSSPPPSQSMERSSNTKLVPGATKAGDCWFATHTIQVDKKLRNSRGPDPE